MAPQMRELLPATELDSFLGRRAHRAAPVRTSIMAARPDLRCAPAVWARSRTANRSGMPLSVNSLLAGDVCIDGLFLDPGSRIGTCRQMCLLRAIDFLRMLCPVIDQRANPMAQVTAQLMQGLAMRVFDE